MPIYNTIHNIFNTTRLAHQSPRPKEAIMDSGASNHFLKPTDTDCLKNIKPAPSIAIKMPDSTLVEANQKGLLPLSKKFSEKTRTARIVPKLSSESVLSVGNVCDDNTTTIFNSKNVYVAKNNEIILEGYRNKDTHPLYKVPLEEPKETTKIDFNLVTKLLAPGIYLKPPKTSKQACCSNNPIEKKTTVLQPKTPFLDSIIQDNEDLYTIKQQLKADRKKEINVNHLYALIGQEPPKTYDTTYKGEINVILRKDTKKKDLARFHHTSLFAPVQQTLLEAIKENYLMSFPGLTTNLVKKHLPVSVESAMGHLNQERQGLQSTSKPKTTKKKTEKPKSPISNEEEFPPSDFLVKQPLLDTFKPDEIKSEDFSSDHFPTSDSPNVKTNNIIYLS